MASTWAKDLPVVTVAHGDKAKHVTLVYPYYENPDFLRYQIARWMLDYDDDVTAHVSLIVVDDGSPNAPAGDVVAGLEHPFSDMRLFRIAVDRRWNWLAARNIGAHNAAEGWLLLTDMDHVVPQETMRSVVYGQHDPNVVYAFSRVEHTGEVINPHSASFLMTKQMFWTIGGYDENLAGFYGSDGYFRKRVTSVAEIQILSDSLVRFEFVGDSSTTIYKRKQPEDARRLRELVASFPANSKPKVLSFQYHEVTC